MPSHRIVFTATTTTELRFDDSTVTTDGDLTVVLQNGERRFAVPSRNVVAIERQVPPQATTPPADEDAS